MMCFLSFKRDIDRNEKRYLDKVEKTKERNRLAYSKQKEMKNKEQKPGQKPEQKKQKANKSPPMTEEQTRFLQRFKEICPDKEIDCNIAEMPTCDYDALMLEIKKSPQFLIVSKNLTLKWCLEHSADIISGKYRETSSEPPTKQKNINHTYSPEELNALFQKPDEVDI